MIDRKNYKEFKNEVEIKNWIEENYIDWLNYINPEGNVDESTFQCLLYSYCGYKYKQINKYLRFPNSTIKVTDTSSTVSNLDSEINIIQDELVKQNIPDSIIVYRYINKELLSYLLNYTSNEAKTFIDPAFISTTLFPSNLKSFAKENKLDQLLKIYISKGTPGAYVKHEKSILNEHEVLFPKNCKVKIIRHKFDFKLFRNIYECILVQ